MRPADPVFRRLFAEALGSMLLVATVIGSGIMAERLAAGNLAVALLANTAATVAVLAALIALLAPISGAHFNPAVSFIMALQRRMLWPLALAYTIAQKSLAAALARYSRMRCSSCHCYKAPGTCARAALSGWRNSSRPLACC